MPTLDTTSTYALIATAVGVLVYLVRKLPVSSTVWALIPPRARWLVPVLLAGLAAFAEAHQSGRAWAEALIGGIAAGLAASGGHHALKDSPLPYGNAVLLLVLSFGATACTGSLESARATGKADRLVGTMAAPAGTPERCAELDDRRQFFGMAAKGAAVVAGGSGVSTIPLDEPDQRDLRTGVAIAGVAAAAIAAGALFVTEGATESWSRECASR